MKLKKQMQITGIILMVALCLSCFAKEPEKNQILSDMETKFLSINSYIADFENIIKDGEREFIAQGRFKYKKPNKTSAEFIMTEIPKFKNVTVSNGTVKWIYMSLFKKAFKYDIQAIESIAGSYNQFFDYIDPKTIESTRISRVDGMQVYIVMGRPNALFRSHDSTGVAKIVLHIDKTYGIVRKIIQYDNKDQLIATTTYSDIKCNIPIDDSEFLFTPPEGAEVIDFTDTVLNSLRDTAVARQP